MASKVRILEVSSALLFEALRIPEGAQMIRAEAAFEYGGTLRLVIADESFAEVPDGNVIPTTKVRVSRYRREAEPGETVDIYSSEWT